MNPAGIYISVPFCRQKCTYCNFASGVHPSSLLPHYLDCVVDEITHRRELWSQAGLPALDVAVDTIYMGGGTPGMLDAAQLACILQVVRRMFHVEHSSEITIEASPENVTPENAFAWAANGINRVSLGVQSMVREELRAVGRLHDEQTVAQAFSVLRAAGIQNISADLIAGLPNQTAQTWERSLRALLGLDPAHFSIYMLEVDDDSRLGREMLQHGERYQAGAVPSEEQVAEFYCAAMERLRASGFEHYEISNFARPGARSRHNQKYWTNAPYFGFGTDAHSYDGERRWANTDSVADYVEMIENGRPPIIEQKALCSREKLEERMFLGLRCREGVSLSRIEAEFAKEGTGDMEHPVVQSPDLRASGQGTAGGTPGDFSQLDIQRRFSEPIREFCKAGWLEAEGDCLRLTDKGVLFSNEVFTGLLLDDF